MQNVRNKSTALIDLAAIPNVKQVYPAELHIKFIEHTIIADTQFEFSTALQPLMREIFQTRSHFINLVLHGFACGGRQIIERLGKLSNALEKVADQICSTAGTDYLGWRVV